MATQVQIRRGNNASHLTFTGAEGEITVDTDKDTLVVHDGSTAGGVPLAKESYANAAFSTANTASTSAAAAFDAANTATTTATAAEGNALAFAIALG